MSQIHFDNAENGAHPVSALPHARDWTARHAAMPPAANSNLRKPAIWSSGLANRSNEAAGILLAATTAVDHGGLPALRPLWAEEAMHRAYSMLRLFQRMNLHRDPDAPALRHSDGVVANRLSQNLFSLQIDAMLVMMPCSRILTETVRDLLLLFGPSTGNAGITTDIHRFTLSAYRRRALVLLAHELVCNGLIHAFPDLEGGVIRVSLRMIRPGILELHVADDGVGLSEVPLRAACSVAGGLASLLGGDLRYYTTNQWATCAELRFPVDEP